MRSTLALVLSVLLLTGCATYDCAKDLSVPASSCLSNKPKTYDKNDQVVLRCGGTKIYVKAGDVTGKLIKRCECLEHRTVCR